MECLLCGKTGCNCEQESPRKSHKRKCQDRENCTSSEQTSGSDGSFFAYPEILTEDAVLDARAKSLIATLSQQGMQRLEPLDGKPATDDDALCAAAERVQPRGLWQVLIEMLVEEHQTVSNEAIEEWTGYSMGQFITSTVLRGDRHRPGDTFGAVDMARSAAFFMAGGYEPFMADTIALCRKALAASRRGFGTTLNNVARDMLRYITMALAHEAVGRAIFATTAFDQVCSTVQGLLELVVDDPGDIDSAMEGMTNQLIAMLDHWGIRMLGAEAPRQVHQCIRFSQEQSMMYQMIAVPIAKKTIAKGRVISDGDFHRALMAQFESSPAA